jgi:lysozyme family protein
VTSFDDALERTLGFEGGHVNHPADRGGNTNYGVTQKAYDAWRKTTGQPTQPVDFITDAEVRELYLADYWKPCNCDALPPVLAACVFDMAVNSGVWNAKITLQRALSVKADGVVGDLTVKAANATPQAVLRFLKQRAALYVEIVQERPSQAVFLHGWINRLLDQAWRPS